MSLSKSVQARHSQARQRQRLYESLTGEKGEYRDFFQNRDIIRENIVVYHVSLQVSYRGTGNELVMDSAVTYKVYALRDSVSDDRVYAETLNALENAQGKSIKQKINAKTTNKVISSRAYNNIKVSPVRGMEISDEHIKDEVIQKLGKTQTGLYVEENDKSFTYKNKKGFKSEMRMDLASYFNK